VTANVPVPAEGNKPGKVTYNPRPSNDTTNHFMVVTTPSIRLGVGLVSMSLLLLELTMIRVFDVILAPNTGFMVLTSAMFALGFGGIYEYLRPLSEERARQNAFRLSLAAGAAALLIFPVFNILPFDADVLFDRTREQIVYWTAMYVVLVLPFFLGGVILSYLFKRFAHDIHTLYFYDLVGAGLACLVFIPLIPPIGPGGILFVVGALAAASAACFYPGNNLVRLALVVAGAGLIAIPTIRDSYFEFDGHANKRGLDEYIAEHLREYTAWDPVSKIDIIDRRHAKLILLDGGQQQSSILHIDKIRDESDRVINKGANMGRQSLAHYLHIGTHPEVLVIGSAGGAQVVAALAFGARHVDAVELVGGMIDAVRGPYGEYSGGVYSHPKVSAIVGEGRTFLRSHDKKYDIIQIHSAHTSSSIASGNGAASTVYLQTVEAYMEYFSSLKPDGTLQINHHLYPRMLTTAAQAWYRLGRKEFSRHVLVLERWVADTLPTVIIRMQPWTRAEVDKAVAYMEREFNRGLLPPPANKPSAKVHSGSPFTTSLVSKVDSIRGLTLQIGTYGQKHLPYDVTLTLSDASGKELRRAVIAGKNILDNQFVDATFPGLNESMDRTYTVTVSAEAAREENGFSIWLAHDGAPVLSSIPLPSRPSYILMQNPVDTKHNLIPAEYLAAEFPYEKAKTLEWNITPATDNKPYFGMVRKSMNRVEAGNANVLDRNTEYLMNSQLHGGIPRDWIHLIAVALVSIVFSLLFVVVPLMTTRLRHARWPRMVPDILYFCCLGLGFILIEVCFIQLFTKIIGFPTHTFTTVVFSMLIAAGIGSMLSGRLKIQQAQRWRWVFAGIVLYGTLFTLLREPIFHATLSLQLPLRILVAVLLITPLGLLLGMPFPLGISSLGERYREGVPWAWALNGFFTVVGGFLAVVLSIFWGFTIVIWIALAIYALAGVSYWRSHSQV